MSNDHQNDAAQKFWNNPDFVEKLLPFLNPLSILHLAQSKISCTLDILQDKENPSNWRKLITRSLPDNFWLEQLADPDLNILRATFEQKRGQMRPLVAILKMMKKADSLMPTQDLLEVICEKSSKEDKNGFIQIRSSSDWSCPISPLGFLLLENVEVEFNSALFEIVSVNVMSMDDLLLTALVARLSRQRRKMVRIDVLPHSWGLVITSRDCAEALCSLIQNCEATCNLHAVRVSANIEASGWTALAKALSSASVSVHRFIASRELAREGRREDLRTIWETSGWFARWFVDDKIFLKRRGEEDWGALEKVLS